MFQKVLKEYKNVERVDGVAKNTPPLDEGWVLILGSNKKPLLDVQSADVALNIPMDSSESETTTSSQVLNFVEESTGLQDNHSTTHGDIATAGTTANTDLHDFLSRPVRISTFQWTTAQPAGTQPAGDLPWSQYLANPAILNKLKNYAFLRATLCLKYIISATPFHYGSIRVAYEPNVAFVTGDRTSKVRSNPTSSLSLTIPYSQLPGTWIYPADNSGGVIRVPFFRHTNWLPLNSLVASQNMGRVTYMIVNPLQLATSTGTTTVTVECFAWLEDVQLSGATNELSLQARDEYIGPVSSVASSVASAAGRLSDVPVIGKFARATEIGAGAAAGIAALFGYTNVPNTNTVSAVVPTANPHLASSEISVPIQKLTLDPKQELSVDPTLHGVSSDDEMSIQNIVSRKSYLTTASWSTTNLVGDVLFNVAPSPALFDSAAIKAAGVTKSLRVYHTPLSYLGMLFTHWRGDIIFEFDVICTKFHKGRLKISWDPLGNGGTTELPENTVYTTILDIGVNNKATFRIPYHQATEWLRCRGYLRGNWSFGTSVVTNPVLDNGMLILSVMTPLMSPVSGQSVGINVSVRAADNFEFANPRSSLADDSSTQPPSFFAVQSRDDVEIEGEAAEFGDIGSKHPSRYALNFGEAVVSLRTLLHRLSIYDTTIVGSNAATRVVTHVKSYSRLPPSYGYDPNGKSTANNILNTPGTSTFNYTPTHPIVYVSQMYGAFRGSVNYVANISQDLAPYVGDVRIQRVTDNTLGVHRRGTIVNSLNTGGTGSAAASYFLLSMGNNSYAAAGAAFTNSQTNASLSWNAPHMSATNFNYADTTYSINGNNPDQSDLECTLLQMNIKQSAAVTTVADQVTYVTYAGSGPDYHCVWWLCCPTVDYYSVVPTSA